MNLLLLGLFFQNVHPTLTKTQISRRLQMVEQGVDLDWATAEALALGSLLYQGNLLILILGAS